jgi:hypothetical protein
MPKLSEVKSLMPEKKEIFLNHSAPQLHECKGFNEAIDKISSRRLSVEIDEQAIADICTRVFLDYWNRYKSNPSGDVFAKAIIASKDQITEIRYCP